VIQRGFACAEIAYRDFLGPAGDGRGFSFSVLSSAAGGAPVRRTRGAMWEYFGPDLALDVLKGLVAGAASLVFQVLAPRALRALKRFRAHWSAPKSARHWFARKPASKPDRSE
jgi:hypothetical protein